MLKKVLFIGVIFLLILSLFSLTSCQKKQISNKPVIVASKIDTEGALLGNMIVILLQKNNIPVTNKVSFGTTDIVRKAIFAGEIDIYPEYTGNGAFFYKTDDKDVWKDFNKGYKKIKQLDYDNHKIVWLTPANANNTWALALRKDIAQKNNIKTLEDLAKYVNNGGNIKLACSEEFLTRPDALPAFFKAYNFKLSKDQIITLSGGNTAQTEKAASQGISGVNLAMAYGTDGALASLGLVVLQDTKHVQPVYAPAPIIREEVLKRYPKIKKILEPVFKSLDLVTLQTLNSKIAIEGEDPYNVAMNYLKEKGFVK